MSAKLRSKVFHCRPLLGVVCANFGFSSTVAPWIETEEGKRVQEKIWKELTAKLEGIQPGISKNI